MTVDPNSSDLWPELPRPVRVKLVTSDAHPGLVAAMMATLDGVAWQRCRTPYAANLMSATPKSSSGWVMAMRHSIYDQPDSKAVPAASLGAGGRPHPHVAVTEACSVSRVSADITSVDPPCTTSNNLGRTASSEPPASGDAKRHIAVVGSGSLDLRDAVVSGSALNGLSTVVPTAGTRGSRRGDAAENA